MGNLLLFFWVILFPCWSLCLTFAYFARLFNILPSSLSFPLPSSFLPPPSVPPLSPNPSFCSMFDWSLCHVLMGSCLTWATTDLLFSLTQWGLVEIVIDLGNSLVVQWLGLGTFTAEGPGSIPGWGNKIPQAMQRGKKKKKIWGRRGMDWEFGVGRCKL